MTDIIATFVSSFHNLPGITVDERRKHFFLLLNQHAFLGQTEDLDHVVRNLKPETHLERLFWVDFLIHFKRFDELLTEFKGANDIVISKIAKERWFFDALFKNLQPKNFVEDVLPTLSCALRLKVLKKLLLPEDHSDEIFDAVHTRYGFFIATSILHRCSVGKIEEILSKFSVHLTPRQLRNIFDKDPNLIYLYIQEQKKVLGDTRFLNRHPLLVYIAQKNPDMFCKLRTKYKFETLLGNRTTKKFVSVKSAEILAKPKKYIDCLQPNSVVHTLGKRFKDLFVLLFPEQTFDFHQINKFLKRYPKKLQFSLFQDTFNRVYYHKLGHNTDLLTDNILNLIYDNDEREKWAKIKYEKHNDDHCLQYFKAENCLKILLPKLNHSTKTQRIDYVEFMTKSCILSRDFDALFTVAKLVSERFRNETEASGAFIRYLGKPENIVDHFSEEMWALIKEITTKVLSKQSYSENAHPVMCHYVNYLYKNGKSIKDVISQYGVLNISNYQFDKFKISPKLQKAVLSELISSKPDIAGEEHETATFDIQLAHECLTYNRKYRTDPLPNIWSNDRLLNSCKYSVKADNIIIYRTEFVLCSHGAPKEIDEIYALHFANLQKNGCSWDKMLWFLKHKPQVVMQHLSLFLKDFVVIWGGNNSQVWKMVKTYSHLKMDEKVVRYYLKELQRNDFNTYKKENTIKPLSIVMSPEEYIKFAETYKPTADSHSTNDLEDEFYKLQCKVAFFLKNVKIPQVILPTALNFCRGDYLRYALPALYSAIYSTPEDKVVPYLDLIGQGNSISVKKHSLFLACEVLDPSSITTRLRTSTIPSAMSALKYFRKNPSEELWEIVKKRFLQVDESSINTLKTALEITIPFTHKEKYNELAWDVIGRLDNTKLKVLLVPKVTYDSYNLASKIIKTLFLTREETEVDQFVVNFLCKNTQPDRFDLVASALSDYKASAWNLRDQEQKARKKISAFIKLLFETFMKYKESTEDLAGQIAAMFDKVFRPDESFDDYVLMSLLTFKGRPVKVIAKSILELNRSLIEKFDSTVLFVFANAAREALPSFFKRKIQIFELCNNILELRKSVSDELLVLGLLPQYTPEHVEALTFYHDTLAKLRETNNSIINLHLGSYLKLSS